MAKFVSSLLSILTGIGVYDGFKIAVLMLFEIWWSQLHVELYVDTHMSSIQPSIHPSTVTHKYTGTHTPTHITLHLNPLNPERVGVTNSSPIQYVAGI